MESRSQQQVKAPRPRPYPRHLEGSSPLVPHLRTIFFLKYLELIIIKNYSHSLYIPSSRSSSLQHDLRQFLSLVVVVSQKCFKAQISFSFRRGKIGSISYKNPYQIKVESKYDQYNYKEHKCVEEATFWGQQQSIRTIMVSQIITVGRPRIHILFWKFKKIKKIQL